MNKIQEEYPLLVAQEGPRALRLRHGNDVDATAVGGIGRDLFRVGPGRRLLHSDSSAGGPAATSVGAGARRLRPILEDPTIAKVGQNLKYDLIVLRQAGLNVQGVAFDSLVADYLLEPG